MTESEADLAGFLPGLEPEVTTSSSPVRPSYEKAIARLLADGAIGDEHAGICASILRLASIADDPRNKAYSINGALTEAHEQMKTLLEVASVQVDDEYSEFVNRQQS